MDVAHQHKQSTRQATARKNRSIATITPAYKGPRRLAFRIRRRGFTFEGCPSLLLINPHGVWSVTHRRYIRKTPCRRFRDLRKDLHPVREKVRSYKMEQWVQYKQDEDLRCLRRKLADLYWSLVPEEEKKRIVHFYRHRRQCSLKCFTAAVVVVVLEGFVLFSLGLMGFFSLRFSLFLGFVYLAMVFLLDWVGKQCGL